MEKQQGFPLIELMIVIAIVAILSAIGLPAYQSYLQKAALTDMLQVAMPYKTAVELCALESGGTGNCTAGSNGIPAGKGSRYVSVVSVQAGTIALTGQESLSGLSVIMTPEWEETEGGIRWRRSCTSTAAALTEACESLFRFDDATAGGTE